PLFNPDSVVWFEPNYGHWLINIFFSMLQFVLCTILCPGNTLPVHPHSSCTSLKQLKTYLHYSTCLMIDHYQDLRNQLLVLLFASCTRLHQKLQILHKDLIPTTCCAASFSSRYIPSILLHIEYLYVFSFVFPPHIN